MGGEAFDGGGGASERSRGRVSGHQAILVGLEQLVDIDEVGTATGAHHDVEVVVFGLPALRADADLGDVEIEILIALVARVEVEDAGSQAQLRQQPRLEVSELGPAGRGPGQVQTPRC